MKPSLNLDVIKRLEGDAVALAVFAVLVVHADREREAWPSQETLAAYIGKSVRTVQRALDACEEAGVLRRRPLVFNGRKVGIIYVLTDTSSLSPRPDDTHDSHDVMDVVQHDTRDGPVATPASCHQARERSSRKELLNMNKEKDIRAADASQPSLAEVVPLRPVVDVPLDLPVRDAVGQVFEAWVDACGRTSRTVLDGNRRGLIKRALKEYPLEDVLDAVRGWRNDPFNCGDNERGATYNDLGLLLRDAAHIEKYRDLWRNGPAKRRAATNSATSRAEATTNVIDEVFRKRSQA